MRISDWSSDVCSSDLLGRKDASVHSSPDSRLRVSPSPTPVPSPQPPAPAPSPPHVLPTIRGQVRTGDPAGVIGDEETHRIGDLDKERPVVFENMAPVHVRRAAEPQPRLQNRDASQARIPCP